MNLVIAILPSLLFGMCPILATKLGGKPINQVLGSSLGQAILGIIVYLIVRPNISINDFFWCFVGGFVWAIAQLTQFMSFEKMNVSTAMPLSTGLQLIEIPLAGVIFWGDWGSSHAKIIGFLSILLLICGIVLTSLRDKTKKDNQKMDYKSGLILTIIGSIGFAFCNVAPKISNTDGIAGVLPMMLGMGCGGIFLGIVMRKRSTKNPLTDILTIKNMIVGLFGGLGFVCYLISLSLNGPATAFPLTQMNVVVSTIGGILILKETKTKKELVYSFMGLILIVIAAFMIGSN
ncbi:EamA family transporter [Lactobacillus sp. S2-2]|uniref:GRP family sugar transporter n=1 Tax=Lactobacillus sp. S2-2 TaxID=2692917 RepID=UPI001F1F3656|nr:GRP family sugar transporter [Lactobacillus sp. S2-2]MCF6515901.1 EamA family transporter [Lactobacillus sp. S2-2]